MKASSIAVAFAAALAVAFTACDDGSPTRPSIEPPSPKPVYSLTGVVTEPVGVPVEGATVGVVDGPYQGKSSTTDSAGHYALVGVEGAFSVQVTKDGYESSTKPVTVPQTLALDVEITPLTIKGNISGNWTLTIEPHPICTSHVNIDARTYRASIVQQGAQLSVTLSGATFVTPPQLAGTIHDLNVSIELPGRCDFYCYYGPTDPPTVIENLGGSRFLGISGTIRATVGRSAIDGTLNGEFVLMRNATAPIDLVAWCSHDSHRVTFTR
jgi:Carboxypeptidase regulatory-like domain